MTKEEIEEIVEQLRNGEMNSVTIKKEYFLAFREVIARQNDKIDFRGTAKHHGDTVYTYEPDWTKL
ncbi:hypothetical protein GN156_00515 [bacterium LRH843]|nr:hypothetical protein [bacterium LRH843]